MGRPIVEPGHRRDTVPVQPREVLHLQHRTGDRLLQQEELQVLVHLQHRPGDRLLQQEELQVLL